ncbi:MAG: phenylalanine--tRNA ligase subunit alpha [Candidatus Lloydbacteria bacterium RIFOXYC12_FULL_46_25]|uniref:phenylalanine--tRNA ligase n=1 Tax=Candidatus Lloydbacteria bacterium RIFOXYC12_FULL_46_25 TaxID=1798670 RepID=A0A1G2E4R6_9BACT|nr:MAG: phenylalanine--tRNA ligase subunit alpha [Candidatus Lloydbacteria bacterium RIFOXYC12_FULL_46_25]
MDIREKLGIDVTLPGKAPERGHMHPVTLMMRDIGTIFGDMGFSLADGPEIETEHYNFDALNIPKDHPARDMWDTFWLKDKKGLERLLLRTHTSPVQIRYMEENEPPIRIIVPGKVFRYEATDATHETQFYQFEGLMIGKNVSMANLKGVLSTFFERLFKRPMQIRFRPSYFPFTEPSVEIDIGWVNEKGKVEKWIEVMGAGMVHPEVLRAGGIDPDEWQGFAFGGGVDRFVMLRSGIPDVRTLYTGDLRLIKQFPII